MVVFEQQIATAQLGRAQMRDPIASYNKMPLADLQAMMPSFPFSLCILRSQSSHEIRRFTAVQLIWHDH